MERSWRNFGFSCFLYTEYSFSEQTGTHVPTPPHSRSRQSSSPKRGCWAGSSKCDRRKMDKEQNLLPFKRRRNRI